MALRRLFGFAERLRIGDHRVQLIAGDGAVIVNERRAQPDGSVSPVSGHYIIMRVDVDAHYERAVGFSTRILEPPTDFPYGERQCRVEDTGGHVSTSRNRSLTLILRSGVERLLRTTAQRDNRCTTPHNHS